MCKGIETAGYVEDIFVEGTQRQGNRRRHKQLHTQDIILFLRSRKRMQTSLPTNQLKGTSQNGLLCSINPLVFQTLNTFFFQVKPNFKYSV